MKSTKWLAAAFFVVSSLLVSTLSRADGRNWGLSCFAQVMAPWGESRNVTFTESVSNLGNRTWQGSVNRFNVHLIGDFFYVKAGTGYFDVVKAEVEPNIATNPIAFTINGMTCRYVRL